MSSLDNVIHTFREQGYVKIEGAYSAKETADLKIKIEKLYREKPKASAENTPYLNRGHEVICNLQSYDASFIRLFLHQPLIRGLMINELNDVWYKQIPQADCNFILRAMAARSGGPQPLPLHLDSFVPSSGQYCWALQVAIVLEDQTPENGCTVVIPGSHRSDQYALQSAFDDAKPIPSRAGDAVVWDSRLWHGTTGNLSGKSRWSAISTFSRWWIKQNYEIPRTLPQEVYAQLTNEEKAVMGFCSMPPKDEYDRVDIKSGYETLKPSVTDYGWSAR